MVGGAIYLALNFDPIYELIFDPANQIAVDMLGDEITQTFGGSAQRSTSQAVQEYPAVALAAGSMVAALLFMIPVAWSYIVIKRQGGYDQSVVHALVILPIAVTGIVIIVNHNLALAFSLAGIAAAVRFRTTLEDTKDAVYIFLAIGVGLACGVQALGVALALSIVFNVVNLGLWKINFGNIYADQFGRTSALGIGDVLAGPGSAQSALSIGDQALLTALSPQELQQAAASVARMERHLEAEEDLHKDRKKYALLLIYTDKVGATQEVVETEIATRCIRWRLAEIVPHTDDTSILEYLVRLKDGIAGGVLLDAVRREGGDHVKAAEFRSLEGLKKKN